jgi:hypothetical protein
MNKPRQLHQRYQREFWPAMAAYIAIMFLLWPLLPRVHSELLKIALAVLPVVPVLFVVRAMVRLVLGSDELEQRTHLIGLAISTTVVSMLSLVGGFLVAAGIIQLDGSVLLFVWPVLVVLYAVGRVWASRHYGDIGDVMCSNGIARHWRLLFIALLLAALAWFGRRALPDYQLGMLCGMSAAFAALQLILAILSWRRRQRGNRETS